MARGVAFDVLGRAAGIGERGVERMFGRRMRGHLVRLMLGNPWRGEQQRGGGSRNSSESHGVILSFDGA